MTLVEAFYRLCVYLLCGKFEKDGKPSDADVVTLAVKSLAIFYSHIFSGSLHTYSIFSVCDLFGFGIHSKVVSVALFSACQPGAVNFNTRIAGG